MNLNKRKNSRKNSRKNMRKNSRKNTRKTMRKNTRKTMRKNTRKNHAMGGMKGMEQQLRPDFTEDNSAWFAEQALMKEREDLGITIEQQKKLHQDKKRHAIIQDLKKQEGEFPKIY